MSEAKAMVVASEKSEKPAIGVSGSVAIHGVRDVVAMAERLAHARGFVPAAYVNNPNAIAAAIMTGMEMGIPPMQSMREIHIIEGKPSISATLMLALARRAGVKTEWEHTDATKATIVVTVPGHRPQKMTFTIEEARAAGVAGKGNWKSYPAAMLRARCASAAIRAFCPEVVGSSVYESDSGELSDGTPSAQIIEGHIEASLAPMPPPAASMKLSQITDPISLRAWCERNRAKVQTDEQIAKVLARAEMIDVPGAEARAWLGLEAPQAAEQPDGGEDE